jgi:hypothetical protein
MSKKAKPSEEQTERFQMRASKEFMQSLDEWRRRQPDLPGRAEAIRRLTELALTRQSDSGGKKR